MLIYCYRYTVINTSFQPDGTNLQILFFKPWYFYSFTLPFAWFCYRWFHMAQSDLWIQKYTCCKYGTPLMPSTTTWTDSASTLSTTTSAAASVARTGTLRFWTNVARTSTWVFHLAFAWLSCSLDSTNSFLLPECVQVFVVHQAALLHQQSGGRYQRESCRFLYFYATEYGIWMVDVIEKRMMSSNHDGAR